MNNGDEPRGKRYGYTLLRVGDENYTVDGLPEVPEPYKKHLLEKPMEAKILSIGPPKTHVLGPDLYSVDHEITIDAGTNDGVYQGLHFSVVIPEIINPDVTVISVEAEKCVGLYTYLSNEKDFAPQDWWRLSSLPWWRNPEKLLRKSSNE